MQKTIPYQRLYPLLLLILSCQAFYHECVAQQSQLYTQFMYNKLYHNAGYAGSLDAPSANAIYRSQWIGLEGAPEAQVLSFHSPLSSNKIALGGVLERQAIGIQQTISLNGIYVYRLQLSDKGKLGLGVNVSARYFEQDFSDPRLVATQGTALDNAISDGLQNKFVANIGFGAYYHHPSFYFGVSIPRLARSDIDFDTNDPETAREEWHLNLMGGYVFSLREHISLTPQCMIRLTEGAPFDFDLNVMLGFYDRFFVGSSVRHYQGRGSLAESIDLLAGMQLMPQLYLGLSYDITLTELRQYSNGSIEIAARYTFIPSSERETYVNPRYF